MSAPTRILAHHTESADPTLIHWIKEQIDAIVGLDAAAIAIIIGLLLVLFPTALMTIVWLQRRKVAARSEPQD